jgi:hypothetical protein
MDTTFIPGSEIEKIELMNRYSIFIEEDKYVYGPNQFNTLDEAIKYADDFIDTIASRFSPKALRASA